MAIKERNIQPRGASHGPRERTLLEVQKNERAEDGDDRKRRNANPDCRRETFASLHWGSPRITD
jgi:hypothetical protein